MIKRILLKIAFGVVVDFICQKAEKEPWREAFCEFAEKIRPLI